MKSIWITLLVSVAACSVDETGYLKPPEIEHIAPMPLGDTPMPVTVVGAPGAADPAPGEDIQVENPSSGARTSAPVDQPTGSFAVTVPARAGDQLRLTYRGETITLTLTALTVATPVPCIGCIGRLVGPPGPDNQVPVNLAMLESPTPPYLIYNEGKRALRAPTVAEVRIPAALGDRICVFRPDSPARCETVSP